MSNYYRKRNFSVVKPFQFSEMPVMQQQEEEEPSWMSALKKGLSTGLGAAMNRPDKKPESRYGGLEIDPELGRMQASGMLDANGLMPEEPQSGYDQARAKYEAALAAPVKKMKPWQDALYKGAVIFSNALNPQNQLPVQGYGRAKYNQNVQKAAAEYFPQRRLEDERIADENRASIIREREEANRLRGVDIERKRESDKNKNAYYEGLIADKAKGRELSETQINDLYDYRQWLMENGDKNTAAKIKQIDERLKDYDLDREERMRHNKAQESQAATNEQGRASRAADVGERAKQRLSQMDARGKSNAINQAVNRWIQQNKGATPEQIADVRARLIQLYGQ